MTKQIIPAGLLLLLACACSNTKNLYEGGTVTIEGKANKSLKTDLESLLRPLPNASFLGWKYKLWVYNLAGTPKKDKGFRHWLKYKVGEAPVLASAAISGKNREILQNRLVNKGFFFDTVLLETKPHKKDRFIARVSQPYTYRHIVYPQEDDTLARSIDRLARRSLLKTGDTYDLDVVKNERTRIDDRLKQRGFYYFSPNYLQLDADTTVGNRQIDATLRIIPSTPAKARQIWHIHDVVVFANYDINTDTSDKKDLVDYHGYKILDTAHLFRPVMFSRNLVFKPGDVYNRNDHNLSLNRLITLGVYKFVKARFVEADTAGPDQLNAFYYLTPLPKKSLQFQVTGLTRSDNTTGGQVSVTWANRNLFRGAELLTATVSAGLDEQFLGAGQQVSTRTFGATLDLFVPRFIAPFTVKTNSAFVPRTKIGVGYQIYDVSNEYNLASAQASFGYIFKETPVKEHTLNIFTVNFVNPTHISAAFQQELDTNITLARSIERQFIIGPNYNFNINTRAVPNRRRNNYYFNAAVDVSANILGLATGADVAKGNEIKLVGTPFSQYDRFELDLRHYLRLGTGELASRITGGVGIAWGNSTTMPFIKEFFAGGTNDVRAFHARQLGPGSYLAPAKTGVILPDQPGDVKLEANAEYRFKIFSILRGALFADAGNVWTLRADTARPGSQFTGGFARQIAVGVGTGLRFDVKILVLRVDLGVPVRQPWDGRWVFRNVGDISKTVLNLAIGYPF
ncbi:translocation and assembly module lipoprotein TamL [Dinghuibacter silviterrae]|uniref:Surface antigen-like protein n=1 Tax=Dinghuibacter silviterrae TaxID=1539049 RepID=A0A4R8DTW0_9BACT|nr:BamA/TamA family outer membrane protein [Dinghuibacter silviterrae]TDX01358.1 surface antigen-like protein [Dinghuibacter silviterrae]